MTSTSNTFEDAWTRPPTERVTSTRISATFALLAKNEQKLFSAGDEVLLNQLAARSLETGIRLAFLVNIDQWLTSKGLPRKWLCKCVKGVEDSSIQKWFSAGEIATEHLGCLFQEFADEFPTISEAGFHATRWLVGTLQARLTGRPRAATVPWSDFAFLVEAHRLDTENLTEAFAQMPEDMQRLHPDYGLEAFVQAMEKWGRYYRFAITRRRFLVKGIDPV